MKKTKEDAEITRKRLIQASYEIMREKGYQRMTRDDIANRVGMTRGAVNWHFKSKEDIYVAVMTDILDEMEQIRQKYQENPDISVEEKLTGLFNAPVQYLEKFEFINQIPSYIFEEPEFYEISQRMIQNRKEFIEYLYRCLEEIEREKGGTFKVPKKDLANILYFMYEGLHSNKLKRVFGEEITREKIAQYLKIVPFSLKI